METSLFIADDPDRGMSDVMYACRPSTYDGAATLIHEQPGALDPEHGSEREHEGPY